jgi:sugar O-acyltransferase (sialic acid O-acetyltransferase NeuD family)
MKQVIIIGASGHARVIADIILKSGDKVLGFLDDNIDLPNKIIDIPYLGLISEINRYKKECNFIIGIGNNQIRKKIAQQYDVNWYTAIHPSASIAIDTVVGKGTVIMANAVINTSASIGKHCIINTGSVIEHDNCLADYVHISPNATLCGTVNIGEQTHIGAGAVIKNNINICSNVIIGAGGVVVSNIEKEGTYIGVPIRRIDMKCEISVNSGGNHLDS